MTNVISVRFNKKGKIYYFDPEQHDVPTGANVVVETENGNEFGMCVRGNHEVRDNAIVPPLRPVIRIATEEDEQRVALNNTRNAEAFDVCRKKIEEHGLPMKLDAAEYSFDGNLIQFFFTADGRVDFRELVHDLQSLFKMRIKLKQIGMRDETKMRGGLGICGKQFCCSQFLNEFHSVSIKMAKTQGLSLNPAKISGTCGKLMCCLRYEEEAYEDLNAKAPKVDAFVETPGGKGSVISVNLLRGSVKVRLEDGNDTTLKSFSFEELDVLGGKTRRAEYQVAKAEGRLEEAGFKPSVIAKPETRFVPDTPPPSRPNRRNNAPQQPQPQQSPQSSAPRPEPVKKHRASAKHERHDENDETFERPAIEPIKPSKPNRNRYHKRRKKDSE